ncbi:MAG: prepilin peptidase, partial [Mahellales bacterium]
MTIGSFLNVCIYRIPREQSLITPGSYCTKCGNSLKPRDLVPLLSYIFVKGRCRYCKEPISIRYPLVELLSGFLFLLVYYQYGLSLISVCYIILVSCLIAATFIDIEHGIIPDG